MQAVITRTLGLGIIIAGLASGFALIAPTAHAITGSDFNNARIMDDDIFFNKNSMNTGDIQNFLNAKVPSCDPNGTQPSGRAGYPTRADWGRANGAPPPYTCLKDYTTSFGSISGDASCSFIGGGTKSAAEIISTVAQACGINPQVLIIQIQKEQSLVTDEWPWPVQYRSATGYGCPDSAPCDANYYGLFNQVYRAGRQLKQYTQQPQNFNNAIGRTRFTPYKPNNPGCGGSNITPQTQATAALYNYTPYQPNAAALANLYGLGDGCSSYGNRNFWRLFNDWFGPTLTDGYTLAVNENDLTQWVIYRGVRQYVPTAEIKRAWGLPDQAVEMPNDYLATIPQGPSLGRLFHLIGDPTLYFADGGKKYRVTSQQMKQAWGLSGAEAYVSLGLWNLPAYGGFLTYSVKKESNPALYMVDGLNGSNQPVIRQYDNPDVFHAWEGDVASWTTVSDDYFSEIDNAIGTSLSGYTIKGSTAQQYHTIAGQKLALSAATAAVFNQSVQTVSDTTIQRLVTSAPVTNFVRLPGDGVTIFMVDGNGKHAVASPDVLKAWSPGGTPNVNILNQGFLNLLSSGSALNGYEVDVAGQLYIMDGRKIPVTAPMDSTYRTGSVFSTNAALVDLFSTSANATAFLKGSGPEVYLMDQGIRRHIPSARDWQLWNGTRGEELTIVQAGVLEQFSTGAQAKFYFSASGTNYVMDNGTYRSVSAGVADDWSLSSPSSISTTTRDHFTAGSALSQQTQVGANYYRIKYGKSHTTTNAVVADIWGITSPVSVSNALINTVSASSELSIFARSTDTTDQRIFLVDDGGTTFYHLTSVEQFLSYGYGGGDFIVAVQPSDLGTPSEAKNIIRTATNSSERVIDGGQKHPFTDTAVRDRWVTGSNTLTVSDALWSYFGVGATLTGNVKGSSPKVYNIDAGTKRWVQSSGTYQTYAGQYGSFSQISEQLNTLLPEGAALP